MDNAVPTTDKQAFVVAVTGGSGSGKTTFVRRLVKAVGSSRSLVLELDHYYRDLCHLSLEERARVNFDHPGSLELDLFVEHLTALAQGQSVSRPIYDFSTHSRRLETVVLSPKPVLLVDGIFALYDHRVTSLAKLRLFIDTTADLRLSRRIRRDLEERGRSLESTLSQYFGTVQPMFERFIAPTRVQADLIIPWHFYNDRAVTLIAAAIEADLTQRQS